MRCNFWSTLGEMHEQLRIFDYFLVAGLPENPVELTPGAQECGYRNNAVLAPITDLCVIFPYLGEEVPEGFICVATTPSGHPADLNHGSIRQQCCHLCYRRGFHKPPIVDIGVLCEGSDERPWADSTVIQTTPAGRVANVNNAKEGLFITFRRAPENAPSNLFSVSDICVILANKGETPPHTFYKINKNLNRGLVGSDVYLCYKKSLSNVNRIAYKPGLLDRFPLNDIAEYPLPVNVPIFCLPMGALIECWPAKCQKPPQQFTTFVLTDRDGQKLYGASVTFYEDYEKPLTFEQIKSLGLQSDSANQPGSCSDSSSTNDPAEQMTFHVNKCICVVSRFPFFPAFRRYLLYLHRMCLSGKYSLPVERYISFLMFEVPFPTFRRPRVLVQLGNEKICFDNPEDSPLPLSGANYTDFLKLLGPDNCMYLMLLVLLEQKVLIHSLRPWNLTSVAEAICNLIFPFRWQCPYIPQCPLDLAGVLHAPLPFVAGVDSSYFELYQDPPRDVTCIDVDTNTVSASEIRQRYKLSLLPRRPAKLLKQQLQDLLGKVGQVDFKTTKARKTQNFLPVEVDLGLQQKRKKLELEIQETFLRFMATIMKDYHLYLRPIKSAPSIGSTDLEALFDVNGFLRSRDKGSQDFYRLLINTQLFIRFIEERSFLTDRDTNAYLAFFDDCVQRMDQAGEAAVANVKLLDPDPSVDFDHAVIFAPPESPTGAEFGYDQKFPLLQYSLFGMEAYGDMMKPLDPSKRLRLIESTPAAKRTKQETKLALDLARRQSKSALNWAKCLLSYAYTLWFIHLPAFMKSTCDKIRALNAAHCILKRIENARFDVLDEVCYRIMIQMCGLYEQPVLAVKVFVSMNQHGVRPNAVTYGIYNRSVLDAQWPGATVRQPLRHWTKVRNVIFAIAIMKSSARQRTRLRRADSQQSAESAADYISQGSGGSQSVKMVNSCSILAEEDVAMPVDKQSSSGDQGYQSQSADDQLSSLHGESQSDQTNEPIARALDNNESAVEWPLFDCDVPSDLQKYWQSDSCLAKEPNGKPSCHSHADNVSCGDQADRSEFDDSNLDAAESSRTTTTVSADENVVRREVATHPLLVVESEPVERPTVLQPVSPLRNFKRFDCSEEPLFQDDDAKKHSVNGGSSDSGRISGFGRSSVRDFFSRLNEAAVSPMSRLVKIRRQSANNNNKSTASLDGSEVTFQSSPAASEGSLGLSPSLANRLSSSLAEAQNKVLSRVNALQRSSGGFARLKTNVSSVINDIKHLKGFDQLGTHVRGSWSASSVRETSNLTPSENKLSTDDIHSVTTLLFFLFAITLWFFKDEWYADKFSCEAELPADDPAFRLSSSMVRLMLNCNSMNDWVGGKVSRSQPEVEVVLCTASRCPNCDVICYDNEIMAGWFADDSDLNARCPFCKQKFVPTLTAVLQPLKNPPRQSWYYNRLLDDAQRDSPDGNKEVCSKSLDSLAGGGSPDADQRVSLSVFDGPLIGSNRYRRRGSRKPNAADRLSLPLKRRLFHSADSSRNENRPSSLNPACWKVSSSIDADRKRHLFIVPFLNLIVLRKELENMVISDGDASLVDEDFLERKPILFWNLVYVFQRLGAPTHFISFIGKFYAKKFPFEPTDGSCEEEEKHVPSVVVRCVHDMADLHRDDPIKPAYFSLSMVRSKQNMRMALQVLMNDHRTRPKRLSPSANLPTHCSMYRDLLFLALWHFGRNLSIEDFEARYEKAFGLLGPSVVPKLPDHDYPPSKAAIACRRVFIPLDII
ncbi:dDENN and uDENN and DENN domain containing protei n [Trichuris trichiura]|uniref:DDENN and uDENN and DENN domain containing protei n n=1 Tax=Trichuris trichiura TaxID=36087 RepID=A0A077YZ52_TRITR|nr:dDENN and uDENN and DENN domain containing protei n [Trichuris trichiura]